MEGRLWASYPKVPSLWIVRPCLDRASPASRPRRKCLLILTLREKSERRTALVLYSSGILALGFLFVQLHLGNGPKSLNRGFIKKSRIAATFPRQARTGSHI